MIPQMGNQRGIPAPHDQLAILRLTHSLVTEEQAEVRALDEVEIPQAKVPYLSNPPLALPCSWSTDWHSESAELDYES